jgi:hypothetical protein
MPDVAHIRYRRKLRSSFFQNIFSGNEPAQLIRENVSLLARHLQSPKSIKLITDQQLRGAEGKGARSGDFINIKLCSL